MNVPRVAVLLFMFALTASFADETNTLPAKITIGSVTYEDVRWGTVTPATVTIFHTRGVATIPLEQLPQDLQKRFGYDPKKAADYRAAQQRAEAASQEARRKQLATRGPGTIEYMDWRNGFRDWTFGQSINKFDGMVLIEKRGGEATYFRQHDSMFAGGNLFSLKYRFVDGKFCEVTGKFEDAFSCQAGLKSLIAAYGMLPGGPLEYGIALEGYRYKASALWEGKKVIATCDCDSTTSDYFFSIWNREIKSKTPDHPDF
jgi:hypothetical protein